MSSTTLQCDGVTLDLPPGWMGQVIPLDYRGRKSMIRAANFALPELSGFASVPERPPGIADPIKGIAQDGIVVTVIPTKEPATTPQRALTPAMVRSADVRSPRGRSIAELRVGVAGCDVDVDVLFGSRQPAPDEVAAVNTILASLR